MKGERLLFVKLLIDFSFILEFVQEQYNLFYGRRAKDREMLFRLIFIQSCTTSPMRESLKKPKLIWRTNGSLV